MQEDGVAPASNQKGLALHHPFSPVRTSPQPPQQCVLALLSPTTEAAETRRGIVMSNEITLDLDQYISEDEKRQIAREEFREACRRSSKENFERILSNAGYEMVAAEVDKAFDDGMAATVKKNAIRVINELSGHSVFSAPNAWDREPSKGWQILQASVDESRSLIQERVQTIIQKYDDHQLREILEERMVDALIEKLKS